jgi:hypothetical protein
MRIVMISSVVIARPMTPMPIAVARAIQLPSSSRRIAHCWPAPQRQLACLKTLYEMEPRGTLTTMRGC